MIQKELQQVRLAHVGKHLRLDNILFWINAKIFKYYNLAQEGKHLRLDMIFILDPKIPKYYYLTQ